MANTRYIPLTEEWQEVVDLSQASPVGFIGSRDDVQLHYSDDAPDDAVDQFATLSERREAITWSQTSGKVYARCLFGGTLIQLFEG